MFSTPHKVVHWFMYVFMSCTVCSIGLRTFKLESLIIADTYGQSWWSTPCQVRFISHKIMMTSQQEKNHLLLTWYGYIICFWLDVDILCTVMLNFWPKFIRIYSSSSICDLAAFSPLPHTHSLTSHLSLWPYVSGHSIHLYTDQKYIMRS